MGSTAIQMLRLGSVIFTFPSWNTELEEVYARASQTAQMEGYREACSPVKTITAGLEFFPGFLNAERRAHIDRAALEYQRLGRYKSGHPVAYHRSPIKAAHWTCSCNQRRCRPASLVSCTYPIVTHLHTFACSDWDRRPYPTPFLAGSRRESKQSRVLQQTFCWTGPS
jgi:hypothetical protein